MGAMKKHGSTLIVLLNTFFGAVGLALFVAGFFVKYATNYVDKYGHELVKTFQAKLPEEIGNKLENVKISEFVGGASTTFIIVGVTILALVVWAYCGICCQSKWMLIVYAALVTAIFVGEVTVVILFVTKRSVIDEKLKEPFYDTLDLYEGSTSASAISLAWNAIMGLFECCGVDGPDNFKSVSKWDHMFDPNKFQSQIQAGLSTTRVHIDAPIVCAMDKGNAINRIVTSQSDSGVDYIQKGCYAAIWTELAKHQNMAIGILAGIGVFQVVLIILTIIVIRGFPKSGGRNRVGPS